jgi:hypothetical protein
MMAEIPQFNLSFMMTAEIPQSPFIVIGIDYGTTLVGSHVLFIGMLIRELQILGCGLGKVWSPRSN